MPRCPTLALLACLVSGPLAAPDANAQGFAAVVSPPRFELAARPGESVRQVVEITNVSAQPATYHLRTSDWQLAPDGGVTFPDGLAADSCRPWVAIERREIQVPGGGSYRYRFEVQPPADTPAGECRFALMIEGDEQTVQASSSLALPISGRIGVIVYVGVGGAAPALRVAASKVADVNGRPLPLLEVSNSGNAHGRLAGFLTGTDARGRRLDFSPSTLPVLPGETRNIALTASEGNNEVAEIAFPVTIKGVLELGGGQRADFEHTFAR
jgi:hypothetical protein